MSAMVNCKKRTVKELYNASVVIKKPEITPVLSGSCRMQGPVNDTDYSDQLNTVSSRVDQGVSRLTKSSNIDVRNDSGRCNLCSVPCSSCLHINQALMGSKKGESLEDTCSENAFSYSVNDVVPTIKSRTCEIGQHTASETSNIISVNSSHDSFSENAESKGSLRMSDLTGASQDVEMPKKLSSGGSVGEDWATLKPQKVDPDKSNLKNKLGDLRCLEGHDDNNSCVSGVNEAIKLSSSDSGTMESKNQAMRAASPNCLVSEEYVKAVPSPTASCRDKLDVEGSQNESSRHRCNEEYIQKVYPPILSSTDFSFHNSGLMENPLSKDIDDGAGSGIVKSIYSDPPNGKSIFFDPSLKDLEVDSCSQIGGEPLECSREHLNPLVTKEVVSNTVCGLKCASYTSGDIQVSKVGLFGGNSESSMEDCLKLKTETDNVTGALPTEALNSVEHMQEVENVNELLALPDAKETSMQSHPVNESDESDIVEHDVCDICGDVGQEDLLAVCYRCSDGAEHTYCMDIMLDEVPKGDWLCQECKFEEKNIQEKDKHGAVEGVGKFQFSGYVGSKNAHLVGKSIGKDADVEGGKTDKDNSTVKISSKRNAEVAEVSSVTKKQALESPIGSPKTSIPNRFGVLSRNSSTKNLDRGKVKPSHQFLPGACPGDNTPETASPTGTRQQTAGGTILGSNSFSTANAKSKVKLFDEAVLKKQKSMREPASLNAKEGTSRVMGKSMSFKSVNSGRLSSGESKVKMLSPKFSHVQDLKGLKYAKERNFVERKNSFKLERSLVSSTISSSTISSPRADQKLASHGETVSFSTNNNRDSKSVPSDSKFSQLSKPVNHVVRKGSEVPVTLGEGKRQLSFSVNRVSNYAEQKPGQARMKDNSSSDSFTADRPISKAGENLPDGFPQSRESTNLAEKVEESSISRLRQGITTGVNGVPCQKCKDTGHSAEFCVVDDPKPLAQDVLTSRSSKEAMDKGNKLRAEIEAAMPKKFEIYRKNRVPDQSDEVSVSSINCEVSLQDSSNSRKLVFGEDVNEGLTSAWNSNTETTKKMTDTNVKQIMLSAEAVTSRTGNDRPILPVDGKSFMKDLPIHAYVATSAILMMSAIPEHEYIWQGCFEVHRSGKVPDLYVGFQAHLSTCASPRVVETMNKFPRKVLLNEVPRLSTWPIQFVETGVKEDHIALYFFPRDYESCEKNYKTLLESMTRNDLALKGDIDGVEILIFPSNQLPVKSQRWNMMFFLWGVFRGKLVNCLQEVSGSSKKLSGTQDTPTAIMSLPENICSLVQTDNNVPTCNRSSDVASDACFSIDLPRLSSTETINGDTKVISHLHKDIFPKLSMEQPEYRLDFNSLPSVPKSPQQSWSEIRSTPTSLKGHVDSGCKVNSEPQTLVQVTRSASDSNLSHEKMPNHSDTTLDWRASAQYFGKDSASVQEFATLQSVGEENIQDSMGTNKDQLKLKRNLKVEAEAVLEREMMRVPTLKEFNSWPLNHRKRSYFDSMESKLEVAMADSSQIVTSNDINSILVDGGSASKKLKMDFSDLYGRTDRSSSSRDGSRIQDVTLSSSIKEKRDDESCDEIVVVGKTVGDTERFFFPINPFPVKHVGLGDSSMSWKGVLQDNDDPLKERVPNLELALGAETKPSKKSIPHFLAAKAENKVNQDQSPGRAATKAEEDDASGVLSLSLSFPFPDKEQAVQSITKTEKLIPERRRINPSLLFGGFSDK